MILGAVSSVIRSQPRDRSTLKMISELFTVVLPISGIVFSLALAIMMRSTKDYPKNFAHLKSEMIYQWLGIVGVADDIMSRKRNQIDLHEQRGRLAIITGGNRGIGLHVVQKLLSCHIKVIMGVRNVEASKKTVFAAIPEEIRRDLLSFETLDTGNLQSVRDFAAKMKAGHPKIDILINNAGIMAAPFKMTNDGFESQMAVNYLGHFLLTHLLLPELRAAGKKDMNARIVNVSSCAHLNGTIDFEDFNSQTDYYPISAYNNSKLAQVMFTKSLQTWLDNEQVPVQTHALHPGVVDTELFEHTSSTSIGWFKKMLFKSAEEGSRTIAYAAISPKIENKGGSYLSNCRFVRSHPMAKDKEMCKKLFEYTCNLLKIKAFGENM